MNLADIISMERVKITDESNRAIEIEYGSKKYTILKASEAYNSPAAAPSLSLRLEQRIEIRAETELGTDRSFPQEYQEIMILHELREFEYREAGFADAHDRAVNDEILYVMKFFGAKKVPHYLKIAENYRKTHRVQRVTFNDAAVTCAYELGLNGNDIDWKKGKAKAAQLLSTDAHKAWEAAMHWSDERFLPYAQQIGRAALDEPEFAFRAGCDWPESHFKAVTPHIINTIMQSVEHASSALARWPDERLGPHAQALFEQCFFKHPVEFYKSNALAHGAMSNERYEKYRNLIYEALSKDPQAAYLTGAEWVCGDEDNEQLLRHMVPAIVKVPEYSFKAGLTWPDNRFIPSAEAISHALAGSDDRVWLNRAWKLWPEDRRTYLTDK